MTPGHRAMTPEQIELIEKVRALGTAIEGLINETKARNVSLRHYAEHEVLGSPDLETLDAAEPERWLAMGRADLQTGLMKLTRSVAQPGFF
jgi:hypothetical protein